MKKKPFFSIIIPTYNRREFLKIAIESVLAQSFHDYQLIIADDGSSDKTSQLIKNYCLPEIEYFYQKNQGPAAARNLGIKKARGKYICFLDSDDRFRKNKLEVVFEYIKKNPEYKIFHTEEIWYRMGKILPQKKRHKKPSGSIFKEAACLCLVSISTAVIKKEVFQSVGLFDQSFPACEDYDFWLRATSKYKLFLVPEYLTIKEGGHPSQQSKKYPAMDRFRVKALEKIIKDKNLDNQTRQIACNQLKNKCSILIQGAKKRKQNELARKYQKTIDKYIKY